MSVRPANAPRMDIRPEEHHCSAECLQPFQNTMRIALFADIHANRQAFEACLAAAQAANAEQAVVLGDLVGYGADPVWCVERTRELQAQGAIVVQGNHDAAVVGNPRALPGRAGDVAVWTQARLDLEQRAFLARLPLTVTTADRCYAHTFGAHPSGWGYVENDIDAQACLATCTARLSFCGHVHRPALFVLRHGETAVQAFSTAEPSIELGAADRWLAVVGSVGQPRDGNPEAAWCLLDTDHNQLHFRTTPYNLNAAMAEMALAGLPDEFALRLAEGR